MVLCPLLERILCAALPFETEDLPVALAGALTSLNALAPIGGDVELPLLPVGPPGAGKALPIQALCI